MWMRVWEAVGPLAGVVVGAILSPWLTWRWQRKQWIWENKKQEYREVLQALGTCVRETKALKEWVYRPSKMVFGGTDLLEEGQRQANQAADINRQLIGVLREGFQVLDDRLFIADALQANDIKGRWAKIEQMAHLPGPMKPQTRPDKAIFDSLEFSREREALATDLRRIAKDDVEAH